jgi:MraZ protein
MLTNTYDHTVDAKNRIFIPAKFRDELGEDIIIAPSVRRKCLVIYSIKEWEKYIAPIREGLNPVDRENVMRYLNGRAVSLFLDSTGRVQLTPELCKHAEFKDKQIKIVGCGDYAEIWDATSYQRLMQTTSNDEMLDIFTRYGL